MIIVLISLFVLMFIIGIWKNIEGMIYFGFIGTIILMVILFASYMRHASNLGMIRGQSPVIEVYEMRVQDLKREIKDIAPNGISSSVLLNADSPVKSMVDQLSEAISSLAEARADKAKAARSIAKREAGPFWTVVKLAGKE